MSRILLVEDDPDIQHLVAYKLGRSGHEVQRVGDGPAALTAVRSHRPDLVILDVRLPGMSGVEVCRELRRDREAADLPVIMLTAQVRPQDADLALAVGADDYITKPFSLQDLVHRVEKLLAQAHT